MRGNLCRLYPEGKQRSSFIWVPSKANRAVSMKSGNALNAMERLFLSVVLLLILKKHMRINNRYNSAHKYHLECIFSNFEKSTSTATIIGETMC